ncbi:MAG: hypothetical protein NXY57DRAFT_1044402, partial [Lentinula lateritia]
MIPSATTSMGPLISRDELPEDVEEERAVAVRALTELYVDYDMQRAKMRRKREEFDHQRSKMESKLHRLGIENHDMKVKVEEAGIELTQLRNELYNEQLRNSKLENEADHFWEQRNSENSDATIHTGRMHHRIDDQNKEIKSLKVLLDELKESLAEKDMELKRRSENLAMCCAFARIVAFPGLYTNHPERIRQVVNEVVEPLEA